jgi:sugar phosphate permease
LVEELGRRGIDHGDAIERIGALSSYGTLAYALGKLFLTGLGDYWGGRRNFLIGVGGAAGCTLLFALGGGFPVFTAAWIGNRLTQSVGWAGLIKVSSKWFDYTSYGSVIGILSISYLIGDALARQQMSLLIAHGYGWRTLFVFAAAVAALALLASLLWLRESRTEEGYAPAVPNPLSLFASAERPPASVAALLLPLMRSPAFLLVCLLSFACTIIREAFNDWTPQYLHDHLDFSVSHAAAMSAIFPGVGAVSALGAGWLSDRLGLAGRSLLLLIGLCGTVAALLLLVTARDITANAALPLATIGLVAFCLLGPYSYLGGAFALDFGGKQASAASSGIIDGIGYLGGMLAGAGVGRLVHTFGWTDVFVALAVISALAALGAAVLHRQNTRALEQAHV